MRFFEFATAVTAIGCGTGVIVSTVQQVFGGRQRQREALTTSEERIRQQAQEIVALRLQNEQLQRQLEWHTRLLEQGEARALSRGR
jgi:peptidoglycan hydrolase CwlO-like protein